MIDNKYPLFSPQLMFKRTFTGEIITKYSWEGFRPSDPQELVSGSVGVAIEKMSKKIDPNNPFFGRAYQFAIELGIDPGFFTEFPKSNELDVEFFEHLENNENNYEVKPKSRVLKK